MALGYYPPLVNFVVRRSASNGHRRREWDLHPVFNIRERLLGWEATAEAAFAAELADFVGWLGGTAGSCASGLDGLRAVEFASAAARSSETHVPVQVGD